MRRIKVSLITLILFVVTANTALSQLKNIDSSLIDRSNKDIMKAPIFNIFDIFGFRSRHKRRFIEQNQENAPVGSYINNPSFKLDKVVLVGNKIYSNKTLLTYAREYIGKEIFFQDILKIITRINEHYHSNGYITSYAFIPPQDVNNVIKIQVAESRVSDISIKGNKWLEESYIRKQIFNRSGITQGKIFNNNSLKKVSQKLKSQNYMESTIRVDRSKTDTTVINLEIEDRLPVSLDIIWDNYGRRLTGRQRAGFILAHDSLRKKGDRLYGGIILGDGSTSALTGYETPIGPYGTKLAFDYSHSRVNLGKEYKHDKIKGKANDYIISIKQPLYESCCTSLEGILSFDILDSNTKIQTLNSTINDYALRVLRFGLDFDHNDSQGKWVASIATDLGTSSMGATKNIPGAQQSEFIKFRGEIARVQRLLKESYCIARTDFQYTPHSLFAAEQLQLGGPYSIRGYEAGALMGDYGFGATIELRTPTPYLKAILPKPCEHWIKKIKLATFYDCGFAEDHHNLYKYNRSFIHSIGTGFHFNITDDISAEINIAMPLEHSDLSREDIRFNFSLNTAVDKMLFGKKNKFIPPLL